MPSQYPSISHARFKGARFYCIGASGTQVACVLQPSALCERLYFAPQRTAPPLQSHSSFLHLFSTFYCSNIICFWKLHTSIMFLNDARARWLALSPHLLLCLAVLIVAFERILIEYITLGFAFAAADTHASTG